MRSCLQHSGASWTQTTVLITNFSVLLQLLPHLHYPCKTSSYYATGWGLGALFTTDFPFLLLCLPCPCRTSSWYTASGRLNALCTTVIPILLPHLSCPYRSKLYAARGRLVLATQMSPLLPLPHLLPLGCNGGSLSNWVLGRGSQGNLRS